MNELRTENTTRANVLALLSDEETATVSMGETTQRLADGDEYLDLEHPSYGVQRASGAATSMKSLLLRRLLGESTWKRILRELERAHHLGGSSRLKR